MMRDIVVNLPLNADRDVTSAFASCVAGHFAAELVAVAFVYDPTLACVEFGTGATRFLEEQEAKARRTADEAVNRLRLEMRGEELAWSSRCIPSSLESAPARFAGIARHFDLAIVAQPDPQGTATDGLIVEAALFESGRPVLVVPYIHSGQFRPDRVALCWNGSAQAARAIADAMPFLQNATHVELLSIDTKDETVDEVAKEDMLLHLQRHAIKVKKSRISAGTDVGSTILNYAAENAPDLIVMGAYGHSRLRELVLGGATRTMLRSMTVPTLMSH